MPPSPPPDDTPPPADTDDAAAPLTLAGQLIAAVHAPPPTTPSPATIAAALEQAKLTARSTGIVREVLVDGLAFEAAMHRYGLTRPDLKRMLDTVDTAARIPVGWERVELYLPADIAASVEQLGRQAIGLPSKGRTPPRRWQKPTRNQDYDTAALAERLKAVMRDGRLTFTETAATLGISRQQVQRVVAGKPIGDAAIVRVFACLETTRTTATPAGS